MAFLLLSTAHAGAQLLASLALVDTDIETFDPSIFAPGPNVDVWNLTFTNGTSQAVTEFDLTVCGPWQNFSRSSFSFLDTTDLPMLGPNTVAESFFVLPDGTSPVAENTIDRFGALSSRYSTADGTALIPAGGVATVAVLSTIAGELGRSDLVDLLRGVGGVATFENGEQTSRFSLDLETHVNCPEPGTAWLAEVAVVAAATRRRSGGAPQ